MKLETFFQKFDLFAEAPDAVPRMRRLVLDLAVQGKLVTQVSNDEPADELLKRVQVEKARLVKTGEIKKQEVLPPIADEELSFPLPVGWVATQLGDVAVCLDYMREPINGTERDLRIAGKNPSELFPYYGATQQQGWIDDYIFDTELVLLGEDGVPFFDDLRSKAYLISGKTWVNNHAHVFRGILVSNVFLMHWLNTFDYTGRVAGSTRSKLNQAKAVDIPIPLPPLAEQKRIVAKVDELMALCDRLALQQEERETRHTALARASLARFADAPTPAHLDLLVHPSYAIPPADLRKSILDLAVYGKLATPAPDDDDVRSVEDFRGAAAAVANSLGLRTPKESVEEAEPPFDIPAHWNWMALADIGAAQTGTTPNKNYHDAFNGEIPFIKPADILPNTIDYSNESLTRKGAESGSRLAPAGSLLMVCIGTIGKCNLIERECAFNQQINSLTPVQWIDPRYLLIAARAPYFHEAAWKKSSSTTIAILNKGKWLSIPIPVPPLAEQRRIVAKVDELMALVDTMETYLATARTTAATLLEAAVQQLIYRN